MDRWQSCARVAAAVALAAFAGASGAQQQQGMGYGVKLGGFFTEQHKAVAKKSYAQYHAKQKTCPKDMERQGKTCRALVQGHYWAVGQPVQKAVETFPLPDEVKAKLPPAPEGYEYVRAGEDILLISKGMQLVVDMMQDVVAG